MVDEHARARAQRCGERPKGKVFNSMDEHVLKRSRQQDISFPGLARPASWLSHDGTFPGHRI
jgi:hypothetical protein